MNNTDHKDFGVFDFMAKVAMASGHGTKEIPGDGAGEAFVETVLVILFIAVFVSLACCSEYINDATVADTIELQGE